MYIYINTITIYDNYIYTIYNIYVYDLQKTKNIGPFPLESRSLEQWRSEHAQVRRVFFFCGVGWVEHDQVDGDDWWQTDELVGGFKHV